VFGFAGLYDIWRSPDGKKKVSTFTIITCKPNIFMTPLHDRMTVILTREAEDIWLDRSITDTDTLMSVLQPYSDGEMYAYRVPELVGNVRNDGPECIKAVT
jgi:putative SOS response-associated peptidase YedK